MAEQAQYGAAAVIEGEYRPIAYEAAPHRPAYEAAPHQPAYTSYQPPAPVYAVGPSARIISSIPYPVPLPGPPRPAYSVPAPIIFYPRTVDTNKNAKNPGKSFAA